MIWKDEVVRQAKPMKMCEENFRMLLQCEDKPQALALYKKTIDWALENHYPDLETISGETFSKQQVYVFHDCHGEINVEMDYEGKVIPMLYFANGCNINIVCRQKNVFPVKFPVYIFGKNTIYTESTDSAIFRIFYNEC